ncbi:uncharacterized protein LOC112528733 [Cynara cardunculus var. scolymus]|uniref:uncharacterized protein LOC112528733 n=1 Tax=Cynara cardunculus var. scolymus TaxID=59895 RepID=UPI000D623A9A|nr:uncharacterized protein LOC112528733 [Cynara cardunculus var. scolymus]
MEEGVRSQHSTIVRHSLFTICFNVFTTSMFIAFRKDLPHGPISIVAIDDDDLSSVPGFMYSIQVSRLSLRKDFLGIDSDGRMYWGCPETSPLHGVVVHLIILKIIHNRNLLAHGIH